MTKLYFLGGFGGVTLDGAPPGGQKSLFWVDITRMSYYGLFPMALGVGGEIPRLPFGPRPGGWFLTPGGSMARYYDPILTVLRDGLPRYRVIDISWDWRLSFLITGESLANRISADVNANDPCTIVAHSSGGLVARVAWWLLKKRNEEGKIRRMITLGTPHRGTYEAVEILRHRVRWVNKICEWANTFVDPLDGNVNAGIRVIGTWPSLYQLFPSTIPQTDDNDPDREWVYDREAWHDRWQGSYDWLEEARTDFQAAMNDPDSLPPPAVLFPVVGNGQPTPYRLTKTTVARDGYFYGEIGTTDDGDGVVEFSSARALQNPVAVVSSEHHVMPRNSYVLSKILDWVNEDRSPFYIPPPAPSPPVFFAPDPALFNSVPFNPVPGPGRTFPRLPGDP